MKRPSTSSSPITPYFPTRETGCGVPTAPWQCCGQSTWHTHLNRIFSDSIDFNHEIYTRKPDSACASFLQQQEYQQLMTYKRLAPVLRKQIKKKERLDEQTLHAFQHANPHFFYVQRVAGRLLSCHRTAGQSPAQLEESPLASYLQAK